MYRGCCITYPAMQFQYRECGLGRHESNIMCNPSFFRAILSQRRNGVKVTRAGQDAGILKQVTGGGPITAGIRTIRSH